MSRVVDVNEHGVDADGVDYAWSVDAATVAAGLARNKLVRLRYPDGRTIYANEVQLTPKGIELVAKLMPGVRH